MVRISQNSPPAVVVENFNILKWPPLLPVFVIRRSVVATGAFGAILTLMFSKIFLIETPRFTSHVLGNHQKAVEDLASQVSQYISRANKPKMSSS